LDPENLSYYNDLGVAYEKVGLHDKAIETMLAKEKIKPGAYETYSNLGTFYILAGDFKQGLPWIDKALAINPDAHFGRERYQKWLVEYAIARGVDGKFSLPLQNDRGNAQTGPRTFGEFLSKKLGQDRLSLADTQSAIKGVLGMMRFANHENPLLLEALGQLLVTQHSERLAACAYLKASNVVADESARQAYRELAREAIKLQNDNETHKRLQLSEVDAAFDIELRHADTWYTQLRDSEIRWIREGKD